MKRLAVIAVLLFLVLGTGSAAPSINYWQFTYNADNAEYVAEEHGNITVKLQNGVTYLTTELSNITEKLEKGMRVSINISVEVSPLSISSGIKIIIGEDVMLHRELQSGNETIEFYALKSYNGTDKFTIVLYDYGGEMSISLSRPCFEEPGGGLNEGLFLTGIGISVVFLVLGILAVVMYLLKPSGKKEEVVKKPEKPEKVVKEGMVVKKEVDEEVVAAITGALSLYLGGKKFRIISVKPSPWKYYGRLKDMRRLK
ncbi:oxaloacetate decarboxylase [Euryarchaeota archaeon ex4484_178]|nr:MAG: oxaloacetate decarboxylase [Euryarchaeota archaeon ex4484_178]